MLAQASSDLLQNSQIQRRTMVECQIRTFDVTDQRLIARFLDVPRESFVPADVRSLAYSDIGLVVPAASPGDEARYLLPPLVLARMIQGARLKPTDRVLDVAPGLGYSTAILAGLAAEVVALEANDSLRAGLAARLAAYGLADIKTFAGNLSDGLTSGDVFDAILINGTVQTNLDRLIARLADGGRLVAIRCEAGDPTGRAAKATCFERRGTSIGTRFLFDASAPGLSAFRETPQFVF